MVVDAAVARIWARSAPLVRSRVEHVEDAAIALLDGGLSTADHHEGARAARALAGSVGSFGFSRASVLAREAELLLAAGAVIAPPAILRLSTIAVALRQELVGKQLHAEQEIERFPRSVLVIEEDSLIFELLATSLGARGIAVHEVNDFARAPGAISRWRPNLIVIDGDMRAFDSGTLVGQLRAHERARRTPIFLVTRDASAEAVDTLRAAGISEHFPKPVDVEQLATKITRSIPPARKAHRPLRHAPLPGDRFSTDVALVDDDGVLTALLCHGLALRGRRCEVMADGIEAVDRLCGAPPEVRPAVILLEVSLAGLDGFAVLRVLSRKGVTARARIIMLTARSTGSEIERALELGAHDYIAKPFSVPVLIQRLRAAFDATAEG